MARSRLSRNAAVGIGEHTRPRVFRPVPRRSEEGVMQSLNGESFGRLPVFREGAEHRTRGRVRSDRVRPYPAALRQQFEAFFEGLK